MVTRGGVGEDCCCGAEVLLGHEGVMRTVIASSVNLMSLSTETFCVSGQ